MSDSDFLSQVTPVIPTYNEAPNIARTLDALDWAKRVVVIDSYSDDETLDIIATYPNVQVYQRAFDCIANQWTHALESGGIDTPWVLALDADYVLTEDHTNAIAALQPADGVNGYIANFRYCVNGKPLRSGIYPPRTTLFRKDQGYFWQDGHTQRLEVSGKLEHIAPPIMHDDRKSLRRWFASQQGYAAREADKILSGTAELAGLAYRIRKLRVVAPFVVVLHCLFIRGGILDGKVGWFYALQRGYAELLLSLELLDRDLNQKK